ncbi:MAG: TonB-dependent receptor, partial [Blastocatellia bacterium]
RNGDFSELLPSIVIYDPATARVEGTRVRRDPFLGNIIPTARLNPIAQKFLSYYPLPNTVGDAQGFNNFLGNNPRPDKYNAQNARFDQTLTERQRAFVRYSHNASISSRGNWPGVINGVTPTGTTLTRDIHSSTIDYVNTLSDNTILNLRSGFSRFVQQIRRFHQDAINPASLGFPASTAALFGPEQYLPRFNITGYSPIGDPLGAKTAHMIYSAQATLTKVVRKHSFKMGYDWRSYRENSYTPGNPAGLYTFGADFTRGPLDNAASAAIGQSLASLLLGLPTAGSIDRNTARSNQSLYHGMFLHDDWKVTPKLTLNLGLRYEYEGAPNERYNRNIRGFDLTAASPVEAAAKSAYAISPIPEVAVSSFNVKGGLLYASDSNRSFWEADTNNVQPRIGVSYQLNDKTVLRGGWGMYTVPFVITGTIQTGFSLPTPITPTVNNGLTFQATLANPFPTGVQTPLGASLGLSALLGQTVTYVPTDLNNSQAQRWSFGMQRELPGNWLIELQYVGNRGAQLLVETNALNAIPKQYLSTSATRDVTTINFLTTLVTNPFRNLIPGTGLNGATVQRQQLLRPFPAIHRHHDQPQRWHKQLSQRPVARGETFQPGLHGTVARIYLVEVSRTSVVPQ